MTARIVVLASGNGGNLQALIDACVNGRLAARIVGVVTDRPAARALVRATDAGVDARVVAKREHESRGDYDLRLRDAVGEFRPDLVVLAGFMRLLTQPFLDAFAGRVLNLHPALPGELPGLHAIERAWDEALTGLRTHTGVMVHLVPDEGVDDGPVVAVARVPIDTSQSLDSFRATIHAVEHALIVDAVGMHLAVLATLNRADSTLDPSARHNCDRNPDHNLDSNVDHPLDTGASS